MTHPLRSTGITPLQHYYGAVRPSPALSTPRPLARAATRRSKACAPRPRSWACAYRARSRCGLETFEHDGTLGAVGMAIRGELAFGRGSIAPQLVRSESRSFVPTRASPRSSRAGAVKVGRRTNLAACSALARPYLDSLKQEKSPGQLDHASPNSSVAGTGQPFLPASLYPAGPRTRTMMQPCASAAKLRSGGPILFLGMTAMAQTGTRHLESSSATRHKRTDWAETVGCLQTALASLNHTCRNLVSTFPQRSPPLLLTTAACGGLRSAPDCRPRRAFLHLSYSYAPPCGPALLVTQCHKPTYAVQQNPLMMLQRRLFCMGRIGSHHFLRSVHNPRRPDRKG